MSSANFTWDDKAFKKALKNYLDLKKNVDPPKELKRRAKNIGLRLVKIYKNKGVNLKDISLAAIGDHIRIRSEIRAKGRTDPKKWTYKRMIEAELRARRSAKGFTATGWFPAVERLGGKARDTVRRTGPRRGNLIEQLTGNNISETLVNSQPGSIVVYKKAQAAFQQAMDLETADMAKYITRKLNEVARSNGL